MNKNTADQGNLYKKWKALNKFLNELLLAGKPVKQVWLDRCKAMEKQLFGDGRDSGFNIN